MREARTEDDPAELGLTYGEILVVIVSLLNGEKRAFDLGLFDLGLTQAEIRDYLVQIVEESYNDTLYKELLGLVQEWKQDFGL